MVVDIAASLAFWEAIPGARRAFFTPPDWAEVVLPGELRLALHRADQPRPGAVAIGFQVTVDDQALLNRVQELGAQPRSDWKRDPAGVELRWFEAPDGHRFYFWR